MKIIKSISIALILSLLLENVSFAAGEIKPKALNLFERPKVSLSFPDSVARVEDSYQSVIPAKAGIYPDPRLKHSGMTVYLLSDAHTNPSGQENLSKALDHILTVDKSVKYVFVEAGAGDDSLSFIRDKAPLVKRKEVATSYLKQGLLHGEEYLDLTSDHSFTIWGVEDLTLYLKALQSYKEVAQTRDKFQSYLDKINQAITTLKPRLLNPSLLELDKLHENFLKEEISLTDYLEKLQSVIPAQAGIYPDPRLKHSGMTSPSFYPHLKALKSLKSLESTINFPKAQEEQQKAILSLSKEDQQELLEYKSGRTQSAPTLISSNDHKAEQAFFLLLEEKLTRSVIPAKAGIRVDSRLRGNDTTRNSGEDLSSAGNTLYPNLSVYFHYLRQAKALNPQEILKEQKALETQLFQSLTHTQDEQTLLKCQTQLRLLKKLFNLTLTPEEYKEYKEHKDSGSWIVDNKNPNPPSTIHHPSSSFTITHLTGFLNKKIMDLKDFYDRTSFLEPGYDDILKASETFYELTTQRDEKFVENMLQRLNENQAEAGRRKAEGKANTTSSAFRPLPSAVLITGGFHTPNLKSMLKSRGISYISITPQVFQETNQKRYEKILFEKAFGEQGVKGFATPAIPSMARDLALLNSSPLIRRPILQNFQAAASRLTDMPNVKPRKDLTSSVTPLVDNLKEMRDADLALIYTDPSLRSLETWRAVLRLYHRYSEASRSTNFIQEMSRKIEADPKNVTALFLRAYFWERQGDFPASIRDYDSVMAMTEGEKSPIFYYAFILRSEANLAMGSSKAFLREEPSRFVLYVQEHYLKHNRYRILEIGSGRGTDAEFLAEYHEVTATDVNSKFVDNIRARDIDSLHAEVLSMTDLAHIPSGSFDVVYIRSVLHYLPADQLPVVFTELKRILRPGGYLFLLHKSIHDPLYGIGVPVGPDTFEIEGHMARRRMFYSEMFMNKLARETGFDVTEMEEVIEPVTGTHDGVLIRAVLTAPRLAILAARFASSATILESISSKPFTPRLENPTRWSTPGVDAAARLSALEKELSELEKFIETSKIHLAFITAKTLYEYLYEIPDRFGVLNTQRSRFVELVKRFQSKLDKLVRLRIDLADESFNSKVLITLQTELQRSGFLDQVIVRFLDGNILILDDAKILNPETPQTAFIEGRLLAGKGARSQSPLKSVKTIEVLLRSRRSPLDATQLSHKLFTLASAARFAGEPMGPKTNRRGFMASLAAVGLALLGNSPETSAQPSVESPDDSSDFGVDLQGLSNLEKSDPNLREIISELRTEIDKALKILHRINPNQLRSGAVDPVTRKRKFLIQIDKSNLTVTLGFSDRRQSFFKFTEIYDRVWRKIVAEDLQLAFLRQPEKALWADLVGEGPVKWNIEKIKRRVNSRSLGGTPAESMELGFESQFRAEAVLKSYVLGYLELAERRGLEPLGLKFVELLVTTGHVDSKELFGFGSEGLLSVLQKPLALTTLSVILGGVLVGVYFLKLRKRNQPEENPGARSAARLAQLQENLPEIVWLAWDIYIKIKENRFLKTYEYEEDKKSLIHFFELVAADEKARQFVENPDLFPKIINGLRTKSKTWIKDYVEKSKEAIKQMAAAAVNVYTPSLSVPFGERAREAKKYVELESIGEAEKKMLLTAYLIVFRIGLNSGETFSDLTKIATELTEFFMQEQEILGPFIEKASQVNERLDQIPHSGLTLNYYRALKDILFPGIDTQRAEELITLSIKIFYQVEKHFLLQNLRPKYYGFKIFERAGRYRWDGLDFNDQVVRNQFMLRTYAKNYARISRWLKEQGFTSGELIYPYFGADVSSAFLITNADAVRAYDALPFGLTTEERDIPDIDALKQLYFLEKAKEGYASSNLLWSIGCAKLPIRWEIEAMGGTGVQIEKNQDRPGVYVVHFLWSQDKEGGEPPRQRTLIYTEVNIEKREDLSALIQSDTKNPTYCIQKADLQDEMMEVVDVPVLISFAPNSLTNQGNPTPGIIIKPVTDFFDDEDRRDIRGDDQHFGNIKNMVVQIKVPAPNGAVASRLTSQPTQESSPAWMTPDQYVFTNPQGVANKISLVVADASKVVVEPVVDTKLNHRFAVNWKDFSRSTFVTKQGTRQIVNGFGGINKALESEGIQTSKFLELAGAGEAVAVPYGNLFINDWFIAYVDGVLYHRHGELYDERTYSCFVTHQDGTVGIEDVEFTKEGKPKNPTVTSAFFGQHILKNGEINLRNTANQFSDLQHLFVFPPYPLKSGEERSFVGFGRLEMAQDREWEDGQLCQAALEDSVEISVQEDLDLSRVKEEFLKSGYVEADYENVNKPGDYAVSEDGQTIKIFYRRASQLHNFIGLAQDGKKVISMVISTSQDNAGKEHGLTLEEAADQMKQAGATEVLLLATGGDERMTIDGQLVVEPIRRPYHTQVRERMTAVILLKKAPKAVTTAARLTNRMSKDKTNLIFLDADNFLYRGMWDIAQRIYGEIYWRTKNGLLLDDASRIPEENDLAEGSAFFLKTTHLPEAAHVRALLEELRTRGYRPTNAEGDYQRYFERRFDELVSRHIQIMDGTRSFLTAIEAKRREGYNIRLFIISHALELAVERNLNHLGIRDCFAGVFGSHWDDLGTISKADTIMRIAGGVENRFVAMGGDSADSDVKAAKEATRRGVETLAFATPTGQSSVDELTAAGAILIVPDLSHTQEIFNTFTGMPSATNREETVLYLKEHRAEAGLHTTTGGKALAALSPELIADLAMISIRYNIMPALDNIKALERLNSLRSPPDQKKGKTAFFIGKDKALALKAIKHGADVLFADEGIDPSIIQEIKAEHPEILVLSEVTINSTDSTKKYETEILRVANAKIDGLILKPYFQKGTLNSAQPAAIQFIQKSYPNLLIIVAGGIFESKVQEVLSSNPNLIAAVGVNKITLPEFEAQVKTYKANIDKALGVAARLTSQPVANIVSGYESRLSKRFLNRPTVANELVARRAELTDNPKFNPDLSVKPLHGLTIIAWVRPESVLFNRLVDIQNRMREALKAAGYESVFSWLDPRSFHMTVADIDPGTDRWNKDGRPIGAVPKELVTERINAVTHGFSAMGTPGPIRAHVQGIGMKGVITGLVRFPDSAELLKALKMESDIKAKTGSDTRQFTGHISLGYFVNYPKKDQDIEEIVKILRQFENEDLGELVVENIDLSYFTDMNHFIPLLTKDLQSGKIIRHEKSIADWAYKANIEKALRTQAVQSLIHLLTHKDKTEAELAGAGIDVLMIPGNNNLGTFRKVLELFDSGVGRYIVISGGKGRLTGPLREVATAKGYSADGSSEAQMIQQIMIQMAERDVALKAKDKALEKLRDPSVTFLEELSSYTLENFEKVKEMLRTKGLIGSGKKLKILYLQTPLQQLRTKGMFEKVFKEELEKGEVEGVSFTIAVPTEGVSEESLVRSLIGELFRIIVNVQKGDVVLKNELGEGLSSISVENWQRGIDLFKSLESASQKSLGAELLKIFEGIGISKEVVLAGLPEKPKEFLDLIFSASAARLAPIRLSDEWDGATRLLNKDWVYQGTLRGKEQLGFSALRAEFKEAIRQIIAKMEQQSPDWISIVVKFYLPGEGHIQEGSRPTLRIRHKDKSKERNMAIHKFVSRIIKRIGFNSASGANFHFQTAVNVNKTGHKNVGSIMVLPVRPIAARLARARQIYSGSRLAVFARVDRNFVMDGKPEEAETLTPEVIRKLKGAMPEYRKNWIRIAKARKPEREKPPLNEVQVPQFTLALSQGKRDLKGLLAQGKRSGNNGLPSKASEVARFALALGNHYSRASQLVDNSEKSRELLGQAIQTLNEIYQDERAAEIMNLLQECDKTQADHNKIIPSFLYQLAYDYFRSGQSQEAIQILNQEQRYFVGSFQFSRSILLAQIHHQLNETESASREMAQAKQYVASHPGMENNDLADAEFHIGSTYMSWNRFPEAEERLKKVIELRPGDVNAWVDLSVIHWKLGRHLDSLLSAQSALAASPNDVVSYTNLLDSLIALTELDKDFEPDLAEVLERLLKVKPGYPFAYQRVLESIAAGKGPVHLYLKTIFDCSHPEAMEALRKKAGEFVEALGKDHPNREIFDTRIHGVLEEFYLQGTQDQRQKAHDLMKTLGFDRPVGGLIPLARTMLERLKKETKADTTELQALVAWMAAEDDPEGSIREFLLGIQSNSEIQALREGNRRVQWNRFLEAVEEALKPKLSAATAPLEASPAAPALPVNFERFTDKPRSLRDAITRFREAWKALPSPKNVKPERDRRRLPESVKLPERDFETKWKAWEAEKTDSSKAALCDSAMALSRRYFNIQHNRGVVEIWDKVFPIAQEVFQIRLREGGVDSFSEMVHHYVWALYHTKRSEDALKLEDVLALAERHLPMIQGSLRFDILLKQIQCCYDLYFKKKSLGDEKNALKFLNIASEKIKLCEEFQPHKKERAVDAKNLEDFCFYAGTVNLLLDKYEDAEGYLVRLVNEVNPNSPQGWINLGICHKEQGKIGEAILDLLHAIRLDPNGEVQNAYLFNVALDVVAQDPSFTPDAVDIFARAVQVSADMKARFTFLFQQVGRQNIDAEPYLRKALALNNPTVREALRDAVRELKKGPDENHPAYRSRSWASVRNAFFELYKDSETRQEVSILYDVIGWAKPTSVLVEPAQRLLDKLKRQTDGSEKVRNKMKTTELCQLVREMAEAADIHGVVRKFLSKIYLNGNIQDEAIRRFIDTGKRPAQWTNVVKAVEGAFVRLEDYPMLRGLKERRFRLTDSEIATALADHPALSPVEAAETFEIKMLRTRLQTGPNSEVWTDDKIKDMLEKSRHLSFTSFETMVAMILAWPTLPQERLVELLVRLYTQPTALDRTQIENNFIAEALDLWLARYEPFFSQVFGAEIKPRVIANVIRDEYEWRKHGINGENLTNEENLTRDLLTAAVQEYFSQRGLFESYLFKTPAYHELVPDKLKEIFERHRSEKSSEGMIPEILGRVAAGETGFELEDYVSTHFISLDGRVILYEFKDQIWLIVDDEISAETFKESLPALKQICQKTPQKKQVVVIHEPTVDEVDPQAEEKKAAHQKRGEEIERAAKNTFSSAARLAQHPPRDEKGTEKKPPFWRLSLRKFLLIYLSPFIFLGAGYFGYFYHLEDLPTAEIIKRSRHRFQFMSLLRRFMPDGLNKALGMDRRISEEKSFVYTFQVRMAKEALLRRNPLISERDIEDVARYEHGADKSKDSKVTIALFLKGRTRAFFDPIKRKFKDDLAKERVIEKYSVPNTAIKNVEVKFDTLRMKEAVITVIFLLNGETNVVDLDFETLEEKPSDDFNVEALVPVWGGLSEREQEAVKYLGTSPYKVNVGRKGSIITVRWLSHWKARVDTSKAKILVERAGFDGYETMNGEAREIVVTELNLGVKDTNFPETLEALIRKVQALKDAVKLKPDSPEHRRELERLDSVLKLLDEMAKGGARLADEPLNKEVEFVMKYRREAQGEILFSVGNHEFKILGLVQERFEAMQFHGTVEKKVSGKWRTIEDPRLINYILSLYKIVYTASKEVSLGPSQFTYKVQVEYFQPLVSLLDSQKGIRCEFLLEKKEMFVFDLNGRGLLSPPADPGERKAMEQNILLLVFLPAVFHAQTQNNALNLLYSNGRASEILSLVVRIFPDSAARLVETSAEVRNIRERLFVIKDRRSLFDGVPQDRIEIKGLLRERQRLRARRRTLSQRIKVLKLPEEKLSKAAFMRMRAGLAFTDANLNWDTFPGEILENIWDGSFIKERLLKINLNGTPRYLRIWRTANGQRVGKILYPASALDWRVDPRLKIEDYEKRLLENDLFNSGTRLAEYSFPGGKIIQNSAEKLSIQFRAEDATEVYNRDGLVQLLASHAIRANRTDKNPEGLFVHAPARNGLEEIHDWRSAREVAQALTKILSGSTPDELLTSLVSNSAVKRMLTRHAGLLNNRRKTPNSILSVSRNRLAGLIISSTNKPAVAEIARQGAPRIREVILRPLLRRSNFPRLLANFDELNAIASKIHGILLAKAPAAPRKEARHQPVARKGARFAVDINTAGKDEIVKLFLPVEPDPKKCGKLVQRIIDGRPYSEWGDLLKVRGIGAGMLQGMKNLLSDQVHFGESTRVHTGRLFLVAGFHQTEEDGNTMLAALASKLPPITEGTKRADAPEIIFHLEDTHGECLTEFLTFPRVQSLDDEENIAPLYGKLIPRALEWFKRDTESLERGVLPDKPYFKKPFYQALYLGIVGLYRKGYRIRIVAESPKGRTSYLWDRSQKYLVDAVEAFLSGDDVKTVDLMKRGHEMQFKADRIRDFEEEAVRINEALQHFPDSTHVVIRGFLHQDLIDSISLPAERKELVWGLQGDENERQQYFTPLARLAQLKRKSPSVSVSEEDQHAAFLREVLMVLLVSPIYSSGNQRSSVVFPLANQIVQSLSAEDIQRVIRSFHAQRPNSQTEGMFEVFYRVKQNFPSTIPDDSDFEKIWLESLRKIRPSGYLPSSFNITAARLAEYSLKPAHDAVKSPGILQNFLQQPSVKEAATDWAIALSLEQPRALETGKRVAVSILENAPTALQSQGVVPILQPVIGHDTATGKETLFLALEGVTLVDIKDLEQAQRDYQSAEAQRRRNTLSQRSLEYQSTQTFLTVEGLRTKVTDPKGFVEIPVSKVGQALESKAEFDSFLSFLKLYLGVRKFHNYYLEVDYLSEQRQKEVQALVEEFQGRRIGTLSTTRPKEGIIARLNFINELNASIPLDFDSQRELLVHVEADFSVGTLPNLIAGLGEAEEAANLYSSYSPNSILPKVEEEEALLQDLAHSQALKIREEFKAQKNFRLNAQILDDLYRGRIKKPETIKASALRSVLRLVEDQVHAFTLMMAAARFA